MSGARRSRGASGADNLPDRRAASRSQSRRPSASQTERAPTQADAVPRPHPCQLFARVSHCRFEPFQGDGEQASHFHFDLDRSDRDREAVSPAPPAPIACGGSCRSISSRPSCSICIPESNLFNALRRHFRPTPPFGSPAAFGPPSAGRLSPSRFAAVRAERSSALLPSRTATFSSARPAARSRLARSDAGFHPRAPRSKQSIASIPWCVHCLFLIPIWRRMVLSELGH